MLVAPLTWKANRVAVLVAVSVLRSVNAIPGVPEAKLIVIVVVAREILEEALTTPLIAKEVNVPTLVSEEAVTPDAKVAPVRVPAAATTPEIAPHKRLPVLSVVRAEEPEQEVCINCKLPPLSRMPFAKVEVAVVPERSRLLARIPPAKVEVAVLATINLSAITEEEAVKAPATWRVLEIVEEAEEINPPY